MSILHVQGLRYSALAGRPLRGGVRCSFRITSGPRTTIDPVRPTGVPFVVSLSSGQMVPFLVHQCPRGHRRGAGL